MGAVLLSVLKHLEVFCCQFYRKAVETWEPNVQGNVQENHSDSDSECDQQHAQD